MVILDCPRTLFGPDGQFDVQSWSDKFCPTKFRTNADNNLSDVRLNDAHPYVHAMKVIVYLTI